MGIARDRLDLRGTCFPLRASAGDSSCALPPRPRLAAGHAAYLWETVPVARGDGRLTHDLLPGEKGPQDACGVFGVWAPGEDVAKLAYFGLYALQHRGQESAGIATGDGQKVLVYKDMGLVSQVFNESALQSLTGHCLLYTSPSPRD